MQIQYSTQDLWNTRLGEADLLSYNRRTTIPDLSRNEGRKEQILHTIVHHYEDESSEVPFLPRIWDTYTFGNLQGEYNPDSNIGTKVHVLPKSRLELKAEKLKRKLERRKIRTHLEKIRDALKKNPPPELKEELENQNSLWKIKLNVVGGTRRRSILGSTVSFKYCVETQRLSLQLDFVEETHDNKRIWS